MAKLRLLGAVRTDSFPIAPRNVIGIERRDRRDPSGDRQGRRVTTCPLDTGLQKKRRAASDENRTRVPSFGRRSARPLGQVEVQRGMHLKLIREPTRPP